MRSFGEEKRRRKNPHAVALVRLGGLVRSELKRRAEPRKRPQGRLGQKPQEDYRRQAQCSPPAAWTAQERLSSSIAIIRTRFGHQAIGLGDAGIRYTALGLRSLVEARGPS